MSSASCEQPANRPIPTISCNSERTPVHAGGADSAPIDFCTQQLVGVGISLSPLTRREVANAGSQKASLFIDLRSNERDDGDIAGWMPALFQSPGTESLRVPNVVSPLASSDIQEITADEYQQSLRRKAVENGHDVRANDVEPAMSASQAAAVLECLRSTSGERKVRGVEAHIVGAKRMESKKIGSSTTVGGGDGNSGETVPVHVGGVNEVEHHVGRSAAWADASDGGGEFFKSRHQYPTSNPHDANDIESIDSPTQCCGGWTNDETVALIDSKGMHEAGRLLELSPTGSISGARRTWETTYEESRRGWEHIAGLMRSEGHKRGATQCRSRWRCLWSSFKTARRYMVRDDQPPYWEMSVEDRRDCGLETHFTREWFELIQSYSQQWDSCIPHRGIRISKVGANGEESNHNQHAEHRGQGTPKKPRTVVEELEKTVKDLCNTASTCTARQVELLDLHSERIASLQRESAKNFVATMEAAWRVVSDIMRDERHLLLPLLDRGIAVVSTEDGSRTSYTMSIFRGFTGALNPSRTIYYVGTYRCIKYSVMDGDSPASFGNEFRSISCPTVSGLLFSRRNFLQDGSYLYAWEKSNRTVLGIDLISGAVTAIPQIRDQAVGDFALTQDGCNMFAIAGKSIMRADFDKPGGKVVKVEYVTTYASQHYDIRTASLDNDGSHLYVATSNGQLLQFPINKSALGECSGALPTPAAPTGAASAYQSPSPAPSTGASPAAGALSSAGHDGSSTGVSGRLADTLSSPSPTTVRTPPRGRVNVGVQACSFVAACLVSAVLGGALVLLVSRSRKSAKAESGVMTAMSTALEHPVERCSALEHPVQRCSALERPS
ncbi:hypothetical protein CBR_g78856 [Chara braunii]|uniref:Myb/SANT-like DNA-binding domain-containing protein n=1 Tax=Chara braunii TaxID=69332 RepID=A0A388KAI7_CHABU|nr:hypothetical protein CBR_g78856 [Chara braunii]|eukprot:GBG67075.1 hypothetical protein CBR_g78856 [Chara braunii]